MAGYPPQQQYAAVHQPPHVTPYHVPSYLLHHQYPSHHPPGDRLHEAYPPSQPQPPLQAQSQQGPAAAGGSTGQSKVAHAQSSQHNMHQSHAASLDRGPAAYDSHRNQSVRPTSQVQSQAAPPLPPPPSHAGPSIPRQHQYGSSNSASQQQHSNQVAAAHHSAAAAGHNHPLLPSTGSHVQVHAHPHQPHGQHVHASYNMPMHPHEYEQQHASLPSAAHHQGASRMMNKPMPGSGQNGAGSTVKRSGGGTRDKEKEGVAPPRGPGGGGGGGAAAKAGAGAKRAGQDKQSGAGGKQAAGGASAAAVAAEKANASTHTAANDEPLQESKKIRKRKEVVDRIHRVHWDTLENREILYHDLQHKLSVESTTLLLWPSNSRPYLMALHRLNLERDAQLRQSALLHAHQVESARLAYDQETQKVEDEARNSKKAVREKLLAAVEDRRRRLREDKESGEGMSDTLLDPSTRPHATRKLRNKATGSSKRGTDGDAALAARVAGTTANGALGPTNGSLLGLLLSSGANGGGTDGTSTPRGGDGNSFLGGLTSMAEFNQLSGVQGPIAALPPSNFDSVSNNAVSLLHLQGVGGGMGDSSYMSGTRVALQDRLKGKKKPGGKGSLANAGLSTGGAAIGGPGATNGHAVNASGADDDEDGNTNSRTMAAAAAAVAAASLAIGTGRLRWEHGKSVGQLTSAKDIEIESDLISIRKMGNKRRRR